MGTKKVIEAAGAEIGTGMAFTEARRRVDALREEREKIFWAADNSPRYKDAIKASHEAMGLMHKARRAHMESLIAMRDGYGNKEAVAQTLETQKSLEEEYRNTDGRCDQQRRLIEQTHAVITATRAVSEAALLCREAWAIWQTAEKRTTRLLRQAGV